MVLRTLSELSFSGKRVVLRADLNVPLKDGEIEDDYRITSLVPTLRAILAQEPQRVVVMSHLGRPKGKDASQSLKPVAERLAEVRRTRDAGRVGQTLDRLRIACQGTENTMPYILDAVRAYATLGEIISVMKEVFGTYQEPTWI